MNKQDDVAALLALKSSICTDSECLPSWTADGDPCSSFDGVYCGVFGGQLRVFEVQLQLDSSLLHFSNGQLLQLSTLRQLVILCVGE